MKRESMKPEIDGLTGGLNPLIFLCGGRARVKVPVLVTPGNGNQKKGDVMRKRGLWVWLFVLVAIAALFGPSVFASSSVEEAAAKSVTALKGQYTWLPECLE